jgi:hypothetical protein
VPLARKLRERKVQTTAKEDFMRIEKGIAVPLGYGKFFRSESIVGLEPVEENRGPGRRTKVYIENLEEPIIASRSENAILGDMTGEPREALKAQQLSQLAADVLNSINEISPMLRSFIRDQAKWDLDRLAERLHDALGDTEE